MEMAMHEMPLALFSTFAPMGAGAFIVLAVAFFTNSFKEDQLKRIDRLTSIPLIFVVAGFIAAFFHLASPLNAINVFAGIGSSPLSNEIACGIVFVVVALIYWIAALTGKLSSGARQGLSAVVAVVAVVFAYFIGSAYMMDTIGSWNTVMVPLSIISFALVGGAAVGSMTIGFAGVASELSKSFRTALAVIAIVGIVGGIAFGGLQLAGAAGMQNGIESGAEAVAGVTMWFVCAAVCLIAAGVFVVLRGKGMATYSVVATILAFAGILIARLAFYATELSVGLSL